MKIVIPIALFIAFLAVGPCPVTGQSQSQVPRIGVLSASSRAGGKVSRRELLKGLENLGYVERKNILMEYRYADNKRGRLPKLASKLVDRNVDILLAYGPPTIAAAIKATKTIPIVMVSGGDVVGRGFVPNLTQPGGNVTGLHSLSKSSGRRIELFKETIPTLSRVVVLNSRKRKEHRKALSTARQNTRGSREHRRHSQGQ